MPVCSMITPLLMQTLSRALDQVPAYAESRHAARQHDPLGTDPSARLKAFMPLTAEDLQAKPLRYIPAWRDPASLREVQTGGTTGFPVTLLRSPSENRLEEIYVKRAFGPLGLEDGMPVAVINSRTPRQSSDGFSWHDVQRNRHWIDSSDQSPEGLERLFALLDTREISLLRGVGSNIAGFLTYCLRMGRLPRGLKAVAYSSDEMTAPERAMIRDDLGLPLISLYGQTERVAMATTPPDRDGFVIMPDYGVVELLRPDGSVITAPGEQGEIAGTALFERAMGLIRYRTGDLASWAVLPGDAAYPAGVLRDIEGRAAQIMTDMKGAGRSISFDLKDTIMASLPPEARIQFVQSRPGYLQVRLIGVAPHTAGLAPVRELIGELRDHFETEIAFTEDFVLAPNGKRNVMHVTKDAMTG